jgi:hypothetical protein
MKKKIILLCIVISTTFFLSCKDKNNTQDKTEQTDNTDEYFILNLDVIADESDTFTMYYLINDMKSISKEKSVSVNMYGSKSIQSLKFQLNEKALPEKLLLKFKNQNQNIQFIKASLTYEGKEFKFEGDRFFQFFVPNQNIEYNRETATATAKRLDDKFNPTFSSRQVLEDKIDFYLYQ